MPLPTLSTIESFARCLNGVSQIWERKFMAYIFSILVKFWKEESLTLPWLIYRIWVRISNRRFHKRMRVGLFQSASGTSKILIPLIFAAVKILYFKQRNHPLCCYDNNNRLNLFNMRKKNSSIDSVLKIYHIHSIHIGA